MPTNSSFRESEITGDSGFHFQIVQYVKTDELDYAEIKITIKKQYRFSWEKLWKELLKLVGVNEGIFNGDKL